MNVHEYQAKELLRMYGVPVPAGNVAYSDSQALAIAEQIGGERWAIKAQIHSGGRGKAGGVKLATSLEEVRRIADEMLGTTLITPQTGPKGRTVRRVLVEEAIDVDREFYLGFTIDRSTQRITLIASAEGGVEIEQIARQSPDKIIRETIDPAVGLLDFQCRKVAAAIGLRDKLLPQAVRIMKRIYRLFRDKDALQAEINPLGLVKAEQRLICLDAKFNFDPNALFRRPEINELRDLEEEDPKEIEASGHGLNYIALNGDIGCIVNGAGLAMATMDAIVLHGGWPANFLDVGGGASPEKVTNACQIVIQDANVKALLVNIFAGINRCDWIATGLVQAYTSLHLDKPCVVRLAGTNVEKGRYILAASGLPFIQATNLDDAAAKAVAIVKGETV
ncbi:MAG: ADP-forming succinate--CoA ligase subunit beta [Methylohalobius sp.]|nr:ADP-forming succinate--CoA ligase subunit beta [Methylohalobius sp.]